MALDEARTESDSAADHVTDHNALHVAYNDAREGAYSTLIETVTVTDAVSTINLVSIPQTFNQLRLEVQGKADGAVESTDIELLVGGASIDTGANYAYHALRVASGTDTHQVDPASVIKTHSAVPSASGDVNTVGYCTFEFPEYAVTTWRRNIVWRGGTLNSDDSFYVIQGIGQWSNQVDGIEKIRLTPELGDWIAGTVVRLYGIR